MAASEDYRAVHEIIEAKREAYLDALSLPDSDWPPDVRIVYEDIHDQLFESSLQVGDLRERCGLYNNNISTRFNYFVGTGIKAYIIHHRLALAKQLLQQAKLPVKYVAFAVGYESLSGFSMIFKSRVGCTPTAFRKKLRES